MIESFIFLRDIFITGVCFHGLPSIDLDRAVMESGAAFCPCQGRVKCREVHLVTVIEFAAVVGYGSLVSAPAIWMVVGVAIFRAAVIIAEAVDVDRLYRLLHGYTPNA
ncbi:MAG: hypothetical protein ACK55I_49815, partial [bacterium]